MEILFKETIEKLSPATTNNAYPIQMLADITILMPKPVSMVFDAWMAKEGKTEKDRKEAILMITSAMNSVLINMSKKIEEEINT